MKKELKLLIAIIAILVIVSIVIVVMMNSKSKTKLPPINSNDDLVALIDKVYEGKEDDLPKFTTQVVDVKDSSMVNMLTGLQNGDDFEYLVTSEPLMSAQAYSFILAKVKPGVNANKVASEISEKINPRKWICVSAEKIYATSSSDIVCIVMAIDEWAKPVYESFKNVAGNVGEEYIKTVEESYIDDFGEILY